MGNKLEWTKGLKVGTTVVIKPVGSVCNLACTYCFYRSGSDRPHRRMSEETLERAIQECLRYSDNYCGFIWHGGEPLLAGIAFYLRAMELQQRLSRPGQIVENMIQTNGTLIDRAWVQFFKNANFQVGISVDGPAAVHNANRKYLAGNGSFGRILDSLYLLKAEGLIPGAIAVVCKPYHRLIRDIIEFIRELGISRISINACIEDDTHGAAPFSLTGDEYAEMLCEAFDTWLDIGDPNLVVRDVDEILTVIFGRRVTSCRYARNCMNFLTIEPDGSVLPCDCFCREPGIELGSIVHDSLSDIAQNQLKKFASRFYGVPDKCRLCDVFDICRAGCPYERFLLGKRFGQVEVHCNVRKMYIDHVLKRLERLTSLAGPSAPVQARHEVLSLKLLH